MKYIVTGAAGLIGSAIVHALNKRGETDILAVDHLGSTTEKWKNLRALHFTDYMEKEDFFAMLKEPGAISVGTEAIIHMGACSSTTETDASYLVRNNYECTKILASMATAAADIRMTNRRSNGSVRSTCTDIPSRCSICGRNGTGCSSRSPA